MPGTAEQELVAHVAAHAGDHAGIEAVRAATHATLSVVGAHLTPAIRELVAEELAPSLGLIVVRAEAGKALPIQEHVLTPEMSVSRADELIASTLTVLAEELSDDVLARLQRELPDALARHLVRPPSRAAITSRLRLCTRRSPRVAPEAANR